MAAGRKKMAPKRGATNARRGRPPSGSAQPKAKTAPPAQHETPAKKIAQKAARGRTQAKRVPSNRTAVQMDAGLSAQLESIAQELGQIRELRAELTDLRMRVEALTGMVESLLANQRAQAGDPGPDVTSEAHRASAENADEPATAGDQRVTEMAGSTPSAL